MPTPRRHSAAADIRSVTGIDAILLYLSKTGTKTPGGWSCNSSRRFLMRDYSKVIPRFWNGDTGKELRGQRDAQVVATYLMTCLSANMIGLYYLALPTLEHEIGITRQGASKALRRVSEVGFAYYDVPSEYVWVVEMARIQIGESLKPDDNRVKGIEKEAESHRKSPFFNDFLKRYSAVYHLRLDSNPPSPFEAPSKPLRSQEQNQEQEQEIEQEQEQERERAASAATHALKIPCGEFQQVLLATDEIQKLKDRLGKQFDRYLHRLDRYSQQNPNRFRKYKSHYAVLLNWFDGDQENGNGAHRGNGSSNSTTTGSGNGKGNIRHYTPKQ